MLDLNRIQRDLESPLYGSLAHTCQTLMRNIRVNTALALCCDPSNRIETVYVNAPDAEDGTDAYQNLRRWPADPRSSLWQSWCCCKTPGPRLFDPADPTSAADCHEIADACSLPNAASHPHALGLSLGDSPVCRVLFIRTNNSPPFEPLDTQRIARFAPLAAHVIEQGYQRQLQHLGINTGPLKFQPAQPSTQDLLNNLSSTEHKVLHLLRQNMTERQAAKALARSYNTVHVHVKSIYRKLRVNNRNQLIQLLKRHDIAANPTGPPQHQAMSG